MKLTERFFIALISFILILISVLLFILALPLVSLEFFKTSLETTYGNLWLTVPSAVLLPIALYVLFKGLQSSPKQKVVSLKVSMGEINISISAVENMVYNVMTKWEDIKANRIKIKRHQEGIAVTVNITGPSEKVIPELVEELQRSIKEHLEVMTGISVVGVSVVLDNISA